MTPRPLRFQLDRPCPKCGVGPTPSRYCTAQWQHGFITHEVFVDGGHLHRKCLHCGFERIELAKDEPLLSDEERRRRFVQYEEECTRDYIEHWGRR